MKFHKLLLRDVLSGAHYYGWFFIIEAIKKDIIDENSNIVLDSFADSCFWDPNKADISDHWIGIVHAVASDTDDLHHQTLANFVKQKWFLNNKDRCLKLITLSKHNADVLKILTNIPVTHMYHPKFCDVFFDIESYFNNPQINQSGFHSRNFLKFAEFDTQINKIMYVNKEWNNNNVKKYLSSRSHNINIKNCFLNNSDYIQNLVSGVGFAYYNDVAASNSLLEHIVSHTPIVVNKHPSVVEYIGEQYPLFYEDIEHDPDRYLLDKKHIIECSNYLKQRSKLDMFSIEKFKQDLLSI